MLKSNTFKIEGCKRYELQWRERRLARQCEAQLTTITMTEMQDRRRFALAVQLRGRVEASRLP